MRNAVIAGLCGAASVVSGCATMPDVAMTYYLPKASLDVEAIRTVGCSADGTLYSADAVVTDVSYSADRDYPTPPIRFRSLSGGLNNSDLALTLADDGRLKGINASTEGQGAEILKSVIQLATTVGLGGIELLSNPPPKNPCDIVKKFGKHGFLTLKYEASAAFDKFGTAEMFDPEPGRPDYAADFDRAFRKPFCLRVGAKPDQSKIAVPASVAQSDLDRAAIKLKLRQPGRVPVSVTTGSAASCNPSGGGTEVWSSPVKVPQAGAEYWLPIPRGAAFGDQSLALALSDSGTINSIEYGRKLGTAGVLDVANAAASAFKPGGTEAETKKLNDESDLIAAEQRSIKCKTDPVNCS
jgi:hypothetical protein